ncbi:MAG: radical SAM protein [Phycisphaerae bacterium]|nr:radical SAM protein [Phycisphaerae bacterium]
MTVVNGRPVTDSHVTHSGCRVPALKRGLPKTVVSLCPECRRRVDAELRDVDGQVRMLKTCPEHGSFEDIYWSDTRLYLTAEEFFYGDGQGLENPQTEAGESDCPNGCGLCGHHASHLALGNIDLTNRCNLRCPVCFANADAQGYVYEPTYEQVLEMLRTFREMQPVAGRVVQYSGGEPTLHPRFLDCLSAAREMGFSHIQIATNGLRFAQEEDFARRCEDAGLHDLYLQFDGTNDEAYLHTRNRRLWDLKQKAIENVSKTDMKIVLVPTIVKGVNDDQVGPITEFALAHVNTVAGISFQPVAFCGRISTAERMAQRYTLADMAHDVCRQTGIGDPYRDFLPLSCVQPFTRLVNALRDEPTINMTCHPHCALGTYLFVGTDGKAVPLPAFIDLPNFLADMMRLSEKTERGSSRLLAKATVFQKLHKHWRGKNAPKGMGFTDLLHTLNGMIDKKVGRGEGGKKTFRTLMVAGMHFMDCYNYEVDRARRCVIHYSTPDKRLYSFCTYNAGPVYREATEHRYAMTPEAYRLREKGHGDTR